MSDGGRSHDRWRQESGVQYDSNSAEVIDQMIVGTRIGHIGVYIVQHLPSCPYLFPSSLNVEASRRGLDRFAYVAAYNAKKLFLCVVSSHVSRD